jgi:hypothetical protein
MTKRPTIGSNPLDALMPESHLDTVVPDLLASPPKPKTHLPEGEKGLQARLAALETENQALREEVEELKKRLAQAEPRWVTLRRLGES